VITKDEIDEMRRGALAAGVLAAPRAVRLLDLVEKLTGHGDEEASAQRVRDAADEMRRALAPLTPAEREAAILEVYEPTQDEAPAPSSAGPKLRADAEANVARVVAIVRRLGPGSVERKAIAAELGVSLQAANKHVRNAILTERLVPMTKSLVALPEMRRAS
jgi:hypothetical protein